MLDPIGVCIPSPSNSSVSSSDLDSQSTGSFFHDRSTSLGTLMGVHFPTITFRTPLAQSAQASCSAVLGGGRKKHRKNKKRSLVLGSAHKGRGRWWSLCRDTDDAKPGSLGEFLEVERRFGEGSVSGFYGDLDVDGGVLPSSGDNGSGVLFSDGRVLPPAREVEESPSTNNAVLCGICCSSG